MSSSWKQNERERAEFRLLTDEELADRLTLLRDKVSHALRPGMGRNPRAARMFRGQLEAAQAELDRRHE